MAIARALLKDPQLIVLDEAASALDSESEHLVQAGLRQLLRDHRGGDRAPAHTVMSADQILVLQGGRVVDPAITRALVAGDGLYAKLYRLQARGQPAELSA